MQLHHRIHHSACQAHSTQAQRRPFYPHDNSLGQIAPDDEPPDHDIVAGQDMSPRRNVSEPRGRSSRIEVINFDKGLTGRVIGPAHDGGVIAGRERGDQRGVEIVRGRQAGGDQRGLLCRAPIVVAGDDRSSRVVQFQNRIG